MISQLLHLSAASESRSTSDSCLRLPEFNYSKVLLDRKACFNRYQRQSIKLPAFSKGRIIINHRTYHKWLLRGRASSECFCKCTNPRCNTHLLPATVPYRTPSTVLLKSAHQRRSGYRSQHIRFLTDAQVSGKWIERSSTWFEIP